MGNDRAIYKGSDAGVKVNLATGTAGGGHAEGDTLTDIENLIGSAHADTLGGDDGDNRFDGGAGADVFVLNPADGVFGDTIADFEDGTDSIRIHGSLSFGDLTITDSLGNASVTWGDGNTLTFEGLDHTLLTADDFDFV